MKGSVSFRLYVTGGMAIVMRSSDNSFAFDRADDVTWGGRIVSCVDAIERILDTEEVR